MKRGLKVATTEGFPVLDEFQSELLPPESRTPRIGEVLLSLGKLDVSQIEFVLEQQAHSPRRFGELAVALGLVTQADVTQALSRLHAIDFEGPEPDDGAAKGLEVLQAAGVDQVETLRSVRSQLMLRWFGDEIEQHTLSIVSLNHGDGRTHVCAALAILIAQLDEDTLVIDADLRRPRMHSIFGVDNSSGLANILLNPNEKLRVLAAPGIPHLHVLPTGPVPANPHELLTRKSFGMLLEFLAKRYSFILIDTPPAATCGEALTIAVRGSGCVLVTRKHKTRLSEAQALADTFAKHSVEVLGTLMNQY